MTFNASLVRRTAKAMKERGLLDAGYKLLSIGGSTYEHAGVAPFDFKPWLRLTVRNSTGHMQIDPARWPGPGSNMTLCEDAAALAACIQAGTNDTRTPEECGCVNGEGTEAAKNRRSGWYFR